MNKHIAISCIIFLTLLFVLPMTALGRAGRGGNHSGRKIQQTHVRSSALTAEQISRIEDLQKKFRDENADALKQLMTRRFDLETVLNSDNPDLAKARAAQKEISELDAELAQKRIDLHFNILKIAPDAKFHGSMGRGFGIKGM